MSTHCYNCNTDSKELTAMLVKDVLYGVNTKIVVLDDVVTESEPVVPDEPIVEYFYVGSLSMLESGINSFGQITETHVKSLPAIAVEQYEMYDIDVERYSTVVIAVSEDKEVKMHNGVGWVPFYVDAVDGNGDPFYCNGEIKVNVDGVMYKLYGIFSAASGTLKINIM